MNVYISSHDMAAANDLARELAAAGHTVVSTWHTECGPKLPISEIEQWELRANRNFLQIQAANALVLIASADKVPGGKFVEAGYAMRCRIAVYTLGTVENGMMNAANQVDDVPALLAALS